MVRRFDAPLLLVFALAAARCATTTRGALDAAGSMDTSPGDAAAPEPIRDATAPDAQPIAVGAQFDVQGHRGARGLRPENTLPSFERALALGVDTLETDLHFSADNALIVWHDPVINERLCRIDARAEAPLPPPPSARPRIRALTTAQLRKYRCDLVANSGDQRADAELVSGDDYHLLELSELFEFVGRYSNDPRVPEPLRERAARVRFDVETKRSLEDPAAIGDGFDGGSPGPFERALVALVHNRGLEERVIVQSFDARSLRAVRTLSATITTSLLTVGPETAETVRASGAAIWSPSGGFATRDAVRAAHQAGLRVIVWTINDAAQFRRLIGNGIDGVITDRPDLLLPQITR
jgi:glycerophosphoryl diester phosphodiesterase